jgi:hypothetical protein
MITFLLITGLIISIILNIFVFVLIGIQSNKIQTYEAWILETRQDVADTLDNMREIDTKGTFATSMNDVGKFESDDEVGHVFKELLELIDKLNKKISE